MVASNVLSPDRCVRWAILGAGRIASTVGTDIAASPGSEVVAVGARSAQRAAALAAQLGASRSYGSYAELVADPDVDVVYVSTTHAQHFDHALLALRAGKPCLVEKAFTLTAAQARIVLDEARAQGLFCMEAMWMRTNPLVRTAVELARGGELGDILSVTADHGQLFPYDPQNRLYAIDAGGGALLDLGVYSITAGWLFLGRPHSVAATGALSGTGSDVTTAIQWHYDGIDRFAHLSCTTAAATPCEATVVTGKGRLRLSAPFYNPDRLVIDVGDEQRVIERGDNPHPYGHEIAEVERCLRAGLLESPLMTWDDTLAILELMDGVRAQIGVHYPADDAPSGDHPGNVSTAAAP